MWSTFSKVSSIVNLYSIVKSQRLRKRGGNNGLLCVLWQQRSPWQNKSCLRLWQNKSHLLARGATCLDAVRAWWLHTRDCKTGLDRHPPMLHRKRHHSMQSFHDKRDLFHDKRDLFACVRCHPSIRRVTRPWMHSIAFRWASTTALSMCMTLSIRVCLPLCPPLHQTSILTET